MTIAIILVHPQLGENIGATARAMKNFGLRDLRIVKPRDGWPDEKAKSVSVGAIDIIDNARIYNSFAEAVGDLEYIYATTGAPRTMNKNYVLSRDLRTKLNLKNNIGIMFGRESSGLNNEEISYADKILTIDTEINFSSLNIAHAVCIICYELFQDHNRARDDLKHIQELATQEEKNYFYDHLLQELDERNFFRVPEKKIYMSRKIRNLFARIDNLSKSELQILRGIVTVLSKEKSSAGSEL